MVHDRTIIHPEEGEIHGDDIDYWLESEAGDTVHMSVAQDVLAEVASVWNDARDKSAPEDSSMPGSEYPYFFTVPAGESRPLNRGLFYPFEVDIAFREPRKIGGAAVLRTTDPGDPYGLTRGGAMLELYTGTVWVSNAR